MPDTPSLDVRSFGAKGDGRADDTAAIQRALDAAGETGGTVFVLPGTFRCSTLRMRPRTGLLGHPTWTYRDFGGSILQLIDDKAPCLLDITGAVGATVNGLCLDGAKLGAGVHGILLGKPDHGQQEDALRIERCRVGHFTGDAVRLEHVWCFSIRSCMLCFSRNGIYLDGWDGFILDNWLSGNRGGGLFAPSSSSVTMTGNRIEWNAGGGIVLDSGSHYNITGNYIDRSGEPAVWLRGSDRHPCRVITLTGNVIYRSGKPWPGVQHSAHVMLEHGQGLVFTGNTLTVGRDDFGKGEFSPRLGIVYRGLSHSLIKDNALHNGALEQLLVDQGAHGDGLVVKDNVGCLFTPPVS